MATLDRRGRSMAAEPVVAADGDGTVAAAADADGGSAVVAAPASSGSAAVVREEESAVATVGQELVLVAVEGTKKGDSHQKDESR